MMMVQRNTRGFSSQIFRCVIIFCLVLNLALPTPLLAQVAFTLPAPGTMISTTPAYTPALLAGLQIHPDNPLLFDFIIHNGDEILSDEALKPEAEKMIKYFFASITVPDKDLWVNLSPYENTKIISDELAQTDLGRDFLTQDYLLKQLMASLIYPEKDLGRKFWERVYQKAYEAYGTTQIPVDTFNKVWITPDRAVVYEHGQMVFVAEATLKVMLERDYLALEKSKGIQISGGENQAEPKSAKSDLSEAIIRDIVIPELEKEVNEGKTFAALRQMYQALILGAWFKQSLRESLLGKIYVDQNKVIGLDLAEQDIKEKIYQRYLEAYKQGAYNFIRPEYDEHTRQHIPRKYFAGGFNPGKDLKLKKAISSNMDQQRKILGRHGSRKISVALHQPASPWEEQSWYFIEKSESWDPQQVKTYLKEKYVDGQPDADKAQVEEPQAPKSPVVIILGSTRYVAIAPHGFFKGKKNYGSQWIVYSYKERKTSKRTISSDPKTSKRAISSDLIKPHQIFKGSGGTVLESMANINHSKLPREVNVVFRDSPRPMTFSYEEYGYSLEAIWDEVRGDDIVSMELVFETQLSIRIIPLKDDAGWQVREVKQGARRVGSTLVNRILGIDYDVAKKLIDDFVSSLKKNNIDMREIALLLKNDPLVLNDLPREDFQGVKKIDVMGFKTLVQIIDLIIKAFSAGKRVNQKGEAVVNGVEPISFAHENIIPTSVHAPGLAQKLYELHQNTAIQRTYLAFSYNQVQNILKHDPKARIAINIQAAQGYAKTNIKERNVSSDPLKFFRKLSGIDENETGPLPYDATKDIFEYMRTKGKELGHDVEVLCYVSNVWGYTNKDGVFENVSIEEDVIPMIEQMHKDAGIKVFALSDTTGEATFDETFAAFTKILDYFKEDIRQGKIRFTYHGHSNSAEGFLNILAAIKAGVREIDVSLLNLGGSPFSARPTGNICGEDLIFILETLGIDTGVDFNTLLRARRLIGKYLKKEYLQDRYSIGVGELSSKERLSLAKYLKKGVAGLGFFTTDHRSNVRRDISQASAVAYTPERLVSQLEDATLDEAKDYLANKCAVLFVDLEVSPDNTEILAYGGDTVGRLRKEGDGWLLSFQIRDTKKSIFGDETNAHKKGKRFIPSREGEDKKGVSSILEAQQLITSKRDFLVTVEFLNKLVGKQFDPHDSLVSTIKQRMGWIWDQYVEEINSRETPLAKNFSDKKIAQTKDIILSDGALSYYRITQENFFILMSELLEQEPSLAREFIRELAKNPLSGISKSEVLQAAVSQIERVADPVVTMQSLERVKNKKIVLLEGPYDDLEKNPVFAGLFFQAFSYRWEQAQDVGVDFVTLNFAEREDKNPFYEKKISFFSFIILASEMITSKKGQRILRTIIHSADAQGSAKRTKKRISSTSKSNNTFYEVSRAVIAKIREIYEKDGINRDDYLMEPIVATDTEGNPLGAIQKGDVFIWTNHRSDRSIPALQAFTDPDFNKSGTRFDTEDLGVTFIPFAKYDRELFQERNITPAFELEMPPYTSLSQRMIDEGVEQGRFAETDKGAHVTKFWDDQEIPLAQYAQDHIHVEIISSEKTKDKDKKPEMKYREVAQAATRYMEGKTNSSKKQFVVINFATDIQGHVLEGNKERAVKTTLATDEAAGLVRETARENGWVYIETADHGNIEEMVILDENGIPVKDEYGVISSQQHAVHNPVYFVIEGFQGVKLKKGKGLASIGPTILDILGIKPAEGMAESLLEDFHPQASSGKVVLVIRDGWGLNKHKNVEANEWNAIELAKPPVYLDLLAKNPWVALKAHEDAVGLPEGQMGDSDNGHRTMGACKVLPTLYKMIMDQIKTRKFLNNPVLRPAMEAAKKSKKNVHVSGLISDGGVHSDYAYVLAILEMAKELNLEEAGVKIVIHAILDGRDRQTRVPTQNGVYYLEKVLEKANALGMNNVLIADEVGRHFGMDRDATNREKAGKPEEATSLWGERFQLAYDAWVYGKGIPARETDLDGSSDISSSASSSDSTDILSSVPKELSNSYETAGMVYNYFRHSLRAERAWKFENPVVDEMSKNKVTVQGSELAAGGRTVVITAERTGKGNSWKVGVQVSSSTVPVGGINFASIYQDLKIKTDAQGSPLAIQFQNLDQIQFEGFMPVIIQMTPMNNLPLLLGFEGAQGNIPQVASIP